MILCSICSNITCDRIREENIAAKENDENIPERGKIVLRQQYALIKAIDEWITELKKRYIIARIMKRYFSFCDIIKLSVSA